MKILRIVALLVFVSGCATASGPVFRAVPQKTPNYSNVILYRPFTEFKKGTRPNVYIDKKKIGGLNTGGFITTTVQPGRHLLTLGANVFAWDFEDLETEFDAVSGENYYFELTVRKISYDQMKAELIQVSEDFAKTRLQNLKHINYRDQ